MSSALPPSSQGWIEVAPNSSMAGLIVRTPVALVTASSSASITSFDGALLQAEVTVGPGIDLSACRFNDAVGLEHLRFAENPFTKAGRYYAIADEQEHVYRQLRRAAEGSRLFDLAADFHIRELQLRARRSSPLVAFGLNAYGVVGGWGHRPLRPFLAWWAMCLFVTLLFVTWPSRFIGGNFQLGGAYVDPQHWHVVFFRFVTRNSLAVMTPIEYGDIHSDGYALFLLAKIGTILLGVFMAMGLRSRLRR